MRCSIYLLVLTLFLAVSACGSSSSSTPGGAHKDGGGGGSAGTTGRSGAGGGAGATGRSGAGGGAGATVEAGSKKPFAAARQACINHINALRATKGRKPFQRWTAKESCVDGQATYDSTHGPHAAYLAGNTCGASSQGECPGGGPSAIIQCINLMWAEKNQAICSGCDKCPSFIDGWNGKCPNCKATASSPTCGHYLALVTSGFTKAACGFSTGKPYIAIDYH